MSTSKISTLAVNGRNAYKAAVKGDWEIIQVFYTREPLSTINSSGDTVLHVLAFKSQVKVTKKILDQLPIPENGLAVQNLRGNTPLHEAIRVGSMDIVEALVHKDYNLVTITNLVGETSLYWAAQYGKREILLFLLGINDSDNLLRRNDNSTILHAAVGGEFYSLASKIISLYPALAFVRNDIGVSALDLLAQSPTSFLSGSIYSHKNLGACPFVPLQLIAMFIYYLCIPSARLTRQKQVSPSGIKALIRRFPWIIMIVDAKRKHVCAVQLLQQIVTSTISPAQDDVKGPLQSATRHGIIEVVKNILEECPETIEFVDDDNKNILHLAVEYQQEQVFEFLKSETFPISRMVTDKDRFGNTPLHLAAKIQEPPMYVHGAYQQMSWDVCWFEQVESISLPSLLSLPNYNGHTAKELFKETHRSLLEEAERWVKNTTNSHMVISTLIATINFTAAFTVPGGFNQETGFPVFLKKTVFAWYLFLLSCALFMSLISLGSAFSANLSRFNEQDYYLFLPAKFLLGVASFFFSVMCTVSAYALGLYLEGNPIATRLRFIVVAIGVLVAHLLTIIVFIDMVSPYFRSVFNAVWHSLMYTPHSR